MPSAFKRFAIAFWFVALAPVALSQSVCLCVAQAGSLSALFFGMTQTQTGGAQNPTVNTPVLRLWDTNVSGTSACSWAGIETSAGVYNFNNCDTFTDIANGNGDKWDEVLGRTPSFYLTTPANCSGTYAPNGCAELPSDTGTTNTHLKNFITAYVNHENSRYPGVTGLYIESINEADLTNECANDAGTDHCSMANLVSYTTAIKTTAQGIDATIQVGCPASSTSNQFGVHLYGPPTGQTPSGGNGYLQQAGASSSCDFINIHPYSYCGTSVSCPSTSSLQATIQAITTLLSGFGITKPVISTETNWGQNPANATMTDADREAWDATFAIKWWNAGFAGDWSYQWTCPSGTLSSCFGTRSGSGVGAGVATAISTTQTWMIGAKHIVNGCNQNADGHGTWECLYTSSGGTANYFVFNDSGNQTFSTVGLGVTTQFNLDGTNSSIVGNSVTAGKIPIRLQ